MHRSVVISTFALSFALAGCAGERVAVIDGKTVARPTVSYADDSRLFAIEHKNAWPQPRGASSGLSGYGGSLWGRVCGSDINFDAEYHRRYLDVSGFVTPAMGTMTRPVHFEARDHDGAREIIGRVGGISAGLASAVGPPIVDFKYNHDALVGTVAWRHFKLHREGDKLVGTYVELGDVRPFEVDGVDELWTMPAPDQIALLPFMLTCAPTHAFDHHSVAPFSAEAPVEVSFRGPTQR